MAKEEKMLILQMVADGQITPEQGVELLTAVGAGKHSPVFEPDALKQTVKQRVDDVVDDAEQVAERAEEQAEKIADSVSSRFDEVGRDLDKIGQMADGFGKVISQLFTGGFSGGPGFKFEEEIAGEFAEDGELDINFSTANGRITVESWDEPGYLLTVRKRINAETEEEAKRILENSYEFRQEGLSLKASTGNGFAGGLRNRSIAFFLKIPNSRKASLNLSSANGRIMLEEVSGTKCVIRTANGRIDAEDCGFGEAKMRTANGRVVYEGAVESIDIATANGRIDTELKGVGDWRFSTANGRIEIEVDKSDDAAYEVELFSNVGRIEVDDMGDVEVLEDKVKGYIGRRRYRARSRGFENAKLKGYIKASSNAGRIGVRF